MSAAVVRPPDVEALRVRLCALKTAFRDEDGLMAVDSELRCLYWCSRTEQLTGLTAGRADGQLVLDLLPWMREPAHERLLRAAFCGETGETRGRGLHVQSADGGEHEARFVPWYDDDNRVVAVLIVVRDLTIERRIREQLSETENRFRNMADHSPVMLWMSGKDATCTFFNASWLAFTGRRLEQELGVGWAEGVHHEDFQRCMDTYLEAFGQRREFEMEYRLRRSDGQWRWILDRGAPRWLSSGEFAGYIGSCIDISQRKQLEADLRRGVRDRDDFLSVASHELKTPLTALQFAVDALLREVCDRPVESVRSEKVVASARRASSQTTRLAALVDDLLDVSRLSAGHWEAERTVWDLATVAREVVSKIAETAAAAGCTVVLDAADGVNGCWDRPRIERALVNLLSNAIKYGRGKPIHVAVKSSGADAVLTVRDEGIGIRPEDQRRIFRRFERAVSPRNYGGFGLGLWIAREVVHAHGGRIEVTSQPGEGATFTVTLDRRAPVRTTRGLSEPPGATWSRE